MTTHTALTLALLPLACALAAGAERPGAPAPVRAAIAAAVAERLGGAEAIEVELLQAPVQEAAEIATATPAPGARLGEPVRFTLVTADGRRVTAVARVHATVSHLVAARPLPRDAELTEADVARQQGRVAGILLQPLPALGEAVGARTRRAVVQGEVISRTVLARPYDVRAGETVAMTVRTGAVEARGVGRAVSSGFVGDVVRILPPGTRDVSRARVIAPAAVEILR